MAKVLIIDDDPDVVEAIEIILQQAGYETVSAGNADEGMAAVERDHPDLLVLDVMMEQPDDGIRMAQELRRMKFSGLLANEMHGRMQMSRLKCWRSPTIGL